MRFILTLCLLACLSAAGQSKKGIFVRIFDEHQKTNKGFLQELTDTSLTLLSNGQLITIPVSDIHTLKLKRSFGHQVIMSTLFVGIGFGIIGAVMAAPHTKVVDIKVGEGLDRSFDGHGCWRSGREYYYRYY